jgi:hypothetical protein
MHLAVMLSDENERLLTAVSWLCPKECAITHQLQEKVALTKLEITHKAPGLSSFSAFGLHFSGQFKTTSPTSPRNNDLLQK